MVKLFLFCLLTFVNECVSQTPGVRNAHGMTYDPARPGIVLFGGADADKVCDDTWIYSNDQWIKLNSKGPPARTFPAMAYTDDGIILFGGNSVLFGGPSNPVHLYDDTWKFSNGVWEKVNTSHAPDGRSDMSMAYDPKQKKVVLFGGYKYLEDGKTRIRLNDTWVFNGKDWERKEGPGPTARSGAVMVYHEALNKIILLGGNPVVQNELDYNGPMWAWDGIEWSKLNAPDSLVFNTSAAYNTDEDYILRFGGWDGKKRITDTKIFRNGLWSKLSPVHSPKPRNHSALIYDSFKKAFFLYGGHEGDHVFGDLWSFKNLSWTLIQDEVPKRRLDNDH